MYTQTDVVTGGWLSHADALLDACSAQLGGGGGVVHVAVTSGQLVPSLAKLLLFRLGRRIAPDRVWSSRYRGKVECFRQVRQRYGARCRYVAIGRRWRWAAHGREAVLTACTRWRHTLAFTLLVPSRRWHRGGRGGGGSGLAVCARAAGAR